MNSSIFVVATNGTGLYYREVQSTNTTVYADREIATFDTEMAAIDFCDQHDDKYWYDDN